jgi:hypothetical protein
MLYFFGFVTRCFVWFNSTTYSSKFYRPTKPEALKTQVFTFPVRDQSLGPDVGSVQGPKGLLGKFLMRSQREGSLFEGKLCIWMAPTKRPKVRGLSYII